ncbi:MAG: efflux RND transporter periplasmic adaptor subunit [Ignavibacteria bacterium]|nr:efflux RND transporter periplasmic adaptor subunit [Ignavibacteria bacterium]
MALNHKRKSKKKAIIFSISGAVIVVLALIVFLGSNKEPIIPVQTEPVKRRTITQLVTATGKIQPEVQVKISPEVSGEIVALPVKEGQKVRKGDLLLRIKPDSYIAQRNQSSAGLLRAKADLSKNELEFRRFENLYQKGLVSESEFDGARAAYEISKAVYAQAKASLDQTEENLRKTTILSPMDGTVSQLNSELGERVLGTNQFQGTDVMTIADLSRMEGRVDVSETDVILVSVGDTARVDVDAFPDRKVKAVVYEIASTAKTQGLGTQEEVTNFEIRMRILDKDIKLRPGMSMTGDIATETKENVLAVPIQSVTIRTPKEEISEEGSGDEDGAVAVSNNRPRRRRDKPKEIVFLVEGGIAKAAPVKRGISDDSYVEITEGLEEGNEVVSGSYKAINRELEDEARVRVEEPKKQDRSKDSKST